MKQAEGIEKQLASATLREHAVNLRRRAAFLRPSPGSGVAAAEPVSAAYEQAAATTELAAVIWAIAEREA